MEISQLDKNFRVDSKIEKEDLKFYDITSDPFQIHGVFYENGCYRRMPEEVAKTVSPGVKLLHIRTAGGRVRFRTDSPYIAVYVELPMVSRMPHCALSGSAGLDLYVREGGIQRYIKTFIPPLDMENSFESVVDLPEGKMQEYVLNFPLYSAVSKLYVGLSENATVEAPTPYKLAKPVVFYGSSITQGGCASRAGNCYQNFISRRLDMDYINLGFSGNAKAEVEMAEYIKNLDMSAFVYDYDHNAKTIEYLAETHERMFRIIREANPELPIVMMPRPKYRLTPGEEKRAAIVRTTYENAIAAGDKNVYFIESRTLMQLAGDNGTVDGTHPNDLGFASMAQAIGDVLEKIL